MKRMIILAIAVACLSTACGEDNVTGPENKFSAEATFDCPVLVAGRSILRVEGINGTIQVTGVSGATAVSISGKRRVEAKSQSEADAGLGVLAVEIDSVATDVVARTVQPTDSRTYIVDYVITIPEDWKVGIGNANGDVTVMGLKNDLGVQCGNGTVSANVDGGNTIVTVANGAISGTVAMAPDGVVNLQLANGAIALQIPQATSAELAATVGNGTITTTNLTLTDVTQTPRSLSGTLGGGAGTILLNVGNGAIAVTGL
jgi:hypothetical protein